jgi:hypothetical protein
VGEWEHEPARPGRRIFSPIIRIEEIWIHSEFSASVRDTSLCGANSFDYLIELQRHAQELAARPAGWMPWNYCETRARVEV